ncbi:MAG: indolepyruvate ferredoxin oxidoreductase family protein [Proteobacteria bacterium]|nr:indolepyruvate ferredoxin oxidoreductase family protein [Pseudomonadota bacterium]
MAEVGLDDKYERDSGRIYLSGTQALVRMLLQQRALDRARGWHTAGYVSGYRGSPLGGFDQQLWRASAFLQRADIHFQPGLNEDIAATAIWGTQQLGLFPGARAEGVFALWYGKSPGVDRSGDALRHANNAGAAPRGGVLVLAGDDHAAKSSTVACHTELSFIDLSMPVLYPAEIEEIVEFGLYGWALSRLTASWVVMKLLPETTDCASSIEAAPRRWELAVPEGIALPPDGLHMRWPDTALAQEERLYRYRLPLLRACLAATSLDRAVIAPRHKRLAIVTAGKAYLDVMQALAELGLDERAAHAAGIAVYKVATVWPLATAALCEFVEDAELVFVIEEKRAVIEPQLKSALYDRVAARRPRVIGKLDEQGAPLVPDYNELSGTLVARLLGTRLATWPDLPQVGAALARMAEREARLARSSTVLERIPHFCAGCPHNTSTKVPAGSRALAGIGCHFMAQWMDRDTATFTHMGGEGASWLGQAPFTDTRHVFVNIGDGTYTHSGSLAIRAAVIAGVNVTYKLLYNDAVAMTGGQPVDGQASVAMITHQMHGEGVKRIAIVSDDVSRYTDRAALAPGVTVNDRGELDAVQRELREVPGVSLLIYEQTCASEKRRRRKRGRMPDPQRRVVINHMVCEGCGDCSTQSNCLAVAPLETEFGRKRRIDQSTCNKDFSCLNGLCPSFVTVEGGQLRATRAADIGNLMVPEPQRVAADGEGGSYNILVTGVGGTGVVTIGNILGMAAHLEGRHLRVLDQTGLAQKYGAVMSHIQVADDPSCLRATRISDGGADLVLGADLVTAASRDGMRRLAPERSHVIVDTEATVVSAFTRNGDLDFGSGAMVRGIAEAVGRDRVHCLQANALATRWLGDAIGANLMLVGYAYQRGLIPMSAAAVERAIAINDVKVEFNVRAFRLGRLLAHDPARIEEPARAPRVEPPAPLPLAEFLERRQRHLNDYQNAAYGQRYRALVDKVAGAEREVMPASEALTRAVAESYFHLLAYKDEYEVARLYASGDFIKRLDEQFEGAFRVRFHLAPPLLAARDPVTGRPRKRAFGAWMLPVFRMLAGLRGLRGTPFDPFGYLAERRVERQLIVEYEGLVDEVCANLDKGNLAAAVDLLALARQVRGYGVVKERSIATYREAVAAARAHWRRPPAQAAGF